MKPAWDRPLWGILFTGSLRDDDPMLIGCLWDSEFRTGNKPYDGEPTRAMLFCTRKTAAAWCKKTNAEWRKRPKGDFVRAWRVKPVRVRETVAVLPCSQPARPLTGLT